MLFSNRLEGLIADDSAFAGIVGRGNTEFRVRDVSSRGLSGAEPSAQRRAKRVRWSGLLAASQRVKDDHSC
jgi:hypothetical protein